MAGDGCATAGGAAPLGVLGTFVEDLGAVLTLMALQRAELHDN